LPEDETALATLCRELQDRFGPMPQAVQRLVEVVGIKILARLLALERLEQRRGEVFVTFHPQTPVQPDQVLLWLQSTGLRFRFPSEHVIGIALPETAPEARFALLKKHLQQLLAGVSMLPLSP
jgi:transcription-repair coupling factor (superfamily II helicase)